MAQGFAQDLRYSLRLLFAQRRFTLVAVATLALGIGASTAIFSVIYAAVVRPLPYPHAEQLVQTWAWESDPGRTGRATPSLAEARAWRADGRIFSAVGVRGGQAPMVVNGEEPERVNVRDVSEGYLELFGVSPVIGRAIGADDVRIGAPAVVMIGARYWQRRFGGRPDVLGAMLSLSDGPATIIGVVPSFDLEIAVWRPLQANALGRAQSRTATLQVYARLRDGLSIDQAQRDLAALLTTTAVANGAATTVGARLESLYDSTTSDYRTTVRTMTWAVGLILLLACVNVGGLLLARGAMRDAELAVRASLGATRLRLVQQMLTESLVLAVAGGAAGIALAWVSLDAIVSIIPLSLPSNAPAALNLPVLAFSVALAIVTSVLFGLIPALKLSRVQLNDRLGRANRRVGGALSRRGGQVLIGVEVALAVVLLAGAGLLVRSFARAMSVDVGFNPEQVVMITATPLDRTPAVFTQYYPAFVGALRAIPGVEVAGAVDVAPLSGIERVTHAQARGGKPIEIYPRQVLPGFFAAIGLPLRTGRVFGDADLQTRATSVVLDEQAAGLLFGAEPAVGRTVEFGKVSREVIGVVGNVRHGGPLWPGDPEAYFLVDPSVARPLTLVMRSRAGSVIPTDRIRQAADSVGPRVLFEGARSGSEMVGDRTMTPRHRTTLFSLMAGLGLLLALVGIAGMTAYAVARRTREIGIRMAFGAQPGDVVATIVKDAAWPVLIGMTMGLGGAAFATRMIASFLFQTTPTDPVTFAAVAALIGSAACLAAWIPARRAARIDPLEALRAD